MKARLLPAPGSPLNATARLQQGDASLTGDFQPTGPSVGRPLAYPERNCPGPASPMNCTDANPRIAATAGSTSMIDTSKYTQNPLVIASNQFAASFEKDPSGDKRAWLKGVRDATRTFYEVLDEHRRDSEEDIGMLHQVLARKPGLMPAATRLAHEHADMLHRASELEIECDRQLASDEPNVEIVRLEASVLRTIVLLHLLRTNDLIYEAYFRTEGGSS